jgi:hypothetical protein
MVRRKLRTVSGNVSGSGVLYNAPYLIDTSWSVTDRFKTFNSHSVKVIFGLLSNSLNT